MTTQQQTAAQTPAQASVTAATDVAEFLTDLDGGQFERKLSVALSQVAAAVVDNGKTGKVTVDFSIDTIPGTHQVQVHHALKFSKPTRDGRASEEEKRSTVLHVGKYGALSLTQLPLPGMQD